MSIVSAWLNSLPVQTVDAVYRWASVLTIGAGVLTVLGSLGAYWASNRSRELDGLDNQRRDGQLKRLDFQRAQLEADLETEREHERMRVQIAEQRERERDATINRLRSELSEAQQLANAAEQRATEAERNIANATSEQRPRELTPDQQKAFLAVATKRPKGRLQVAMVNPDREVPYYFKQVLDLVKRAGWEVVSTTTMADVSAYGLVLVGRQDTEVTAAVRGLLEALRAAGESPRVEVAPWAPDGYPQLLVGYRPIQPAGTR